MTFFQDIADYDEDARIDMIGHQAVDHRRTVGFIVDSGEGKAERYIRKLKEKFPTIRIVGQSKGPVAGTELVRVGPPIN